MASTQRSALLQMFYSLLCHRISALLIQKRCVLKSGIVRLPLFCIASIGVALFVSISCSSVHAQGEAEKPFHTIYEVHSGIGLLSGFNIGGRIQPWSGLGFEASAGLLLLSPTLTAGIDLPAPKIFEGTRPSWSILGTYFNSSDARWYGVSATYGLLQVGARGLHAYGRIGASLMVKQTAVALVYPLPCFDIGLAWTFGDH